MGTAMKETVSSSRTFGRRDILGEKRIFLDILGKEGCLSGHDPLGDFHRNIGGAVVNRIRRKAGGRHHPHFAVAAGDCDNAAAHLHIRRQKVEHGAQLRLQIH